VASATHPNLAPRLKKSRAITLLPICAFMVGYMVNFKFLLFFLVSFANGAASCPSGMEYSTTRCRNLKNPAFLVCVHNKCKIQNI
jgi:hypothetical protein